MLRTMRAAYAGGQSCRSSVAALLLVLMLAARAFATDPNCAVEITARNSDWTTYNRTNIWGINDAIKYEALCSPCDGEHNCLFLDMADCLDEATTESDATDRAQGSCTVPTDEEHEEDFFLDADCFGDGFDHVGDSEAFAVVDISTFTTADTDVYVQGTHWYIAKNATSSLAVTAVLTPSNWAGIGSLRTDFMYWWKDGQLVAPESNKLTYMLSRATAGEYVIKAKAGPGGRTDATVTISVVEVSIHAPHGNPANSPVNDNEYNDHSSANANIGNERTFSSAQQAGVSTLTVPCEVTVTPASAATATADHIKWTITAINGTTLTWDTSWTGQSTVGKGAAPTATFTTAETGLPSSNSAFGAKTVTLQFVSVDGSTVYSTATTTIEVFYPKAGLNHPVVGANSNWPNWMFYWLQTVTPMGTSPAFIYGASTYFTPGTTNITLSAGDATPYSAPYGTNNPLDGIDNFAWTVCHESQHYKDWEDLWGNNYTDWFNNHKGNTGAGDDKDSDMIPNQTEDVDLSGTYNAGDLYDWQVYNTPTAGRPGAIVNDFEDWNCQRHTGVTGTHSADWANPGMQHKYNDAYDN